MWLAVGEQPSSLAHALGSLNCSISQMQRTLPAERTFNTSPHSPSAVRRPTATFSNTVSIMPIPILPLPKPSFCALAFMLCSCSLLVAFPEPPDIEEEPKTLLAMLLAPPPPSPKADVVAVSSDEGDMANVVDVVVVGGAGADVPAVGLVLTPSPIVAVLPEEAPIVVILLAELVCPCR